VRAATGARHLARRGRSCALGLLVGGTLAVLATSAVGAAGTRSARATSTVPIRVSQCASRSAPPFRNAEVEDAAAGDVVYAEWIGCSESSGIGFARSTDGGKHFGANLLLPGSSAPCGGTVVCTFQSWDPALAVAKNGTVYASFMTRDHGVSRPVVDVSNNRGASFTQLAQLPVPATSDPGGNWGDRDFIAVGPNGAIYVTWDYGPSASEMKFICSKIGSCSFSAGDLNIVVQKSTDGGKSWTSVQPISPSFPYGGADLAPIVVQSNGTLDVLFQAFPTSPTTHDLSPGNEYFTHSTNGGTTWSTPVKVGASAGTISLTEWWIDGAISIDAKSNLYATWDTQSSTTDIGWLSYSTDGGATWSAPLRVTPATGAAEELVESVGVGRGMADVAWQTPASTKGYATYVRPFSIAHGWLRPSPLRVSTAYGNPKIWPGDTFGIVALPSTRRMTDGPPIAVTWGSAIGGSKVSEIYSADVTP
jgi:hypothetical protein